VLPPSQVLGQVLHPGETKKEHFEAPYLSDKLAAKAQEELKRRGLGAAFTAPTQQDVARNPAAAAAQLAGKVGLENWPYLLME